MEFLYSYPTTIMASIFALLLILYRRSSTTKKPPPEAGGGRPLIGHLHLLGGPEPTFKTLGKMADKYGPIFTVRLGVQRIVVISTWEMVKECLGVNDKVFASRPKTTTMEILGYNSALFAFSPYGQYWRQVRKIVTVSLLSNSCLEKFKHVRQSLVKEAMENMCKHACEGKALVEMKKWFMDVNLDIIFKIIVGKRYVNTFKDQEEEEEEDRWHEVIRKFVELAGIFVVSDALPCLGWLDVGGYKRSMKKVAKALDGAISQWLEKHKQKREAGGLIQEEDFMDVLLSKLNEDENYVPHGADADTTIKATCLNLILAAAETSSTTLTWAVSLLLNNRHTLKQVQQELDMHVGRERQIMESDMKNLVYLQAIIKETMRLYPAAPLLLPHISMEDCTIAGYHIKAGTQLYVNAPKLHRDPRVWSDPEKFEPERFLTTHKDFDLKGQSFELIPFGTGRRMCPGYTFALQVMHLTLATLLHVFDITTPLGEPVDMNESFGLANLKATPVEVLLSPRLPPHLYV